MGDPMVEITRSSDRLISTMGFPIPIRRCLNIESAPELPNSNKQNMNTISWQQVKNIPIAFYKFHCDSVAAKKMPLTVSMVSRSTSNVTLLINMLIDVNFAINKNDK